MFEGIIGYIIGGAVIGILARFFKPGADPMGWILTILLGIAGALVGTKLAALLNLTSTSDDVGLRDRRRNRIALHLRSPSQEDGQSGVSACTVQTKTPASSRGFCLQVCNFADQPSSWPITRCARASGDSWTVSRTSSAFSGTS